MSQSKLYIDPQGQKYMVLNNQDHIIKDDWVLCPRKEDGNHAENYNLDGTPAPDNPISANQVKGEAGRRILAICPEWKQRNHIATDLTYTKIIQGGGTLTTDQETDRAEMEALWESIQSIRTKSDEIEAMSPIPADFRDDSYWV
jgi:hypothetical protein